MDHLPKVKDPIFIIPDVPYLQDSTFIYTPPIGTYPSRVQSERSKPGNEDRQRTYSSFIQTWLFFGMLHDVFTMFSLPYQSSDFTKTLASGEQVVTNALLNDYLVAWTVQCNAYVTITEPSTHDYDRRARLLQGIGKTIHNTLSVVYTALKETVKVQDVDQRVWDSVIILGATLDRAIDAIVRRCTLSPTPSFQPPFYEAIGFKNLVLQSIPDVRQDKRWCPRERKIIMNLVNDSPIDLAFLGQLNLQEDMDRHSRCSESVCLAYQITERTSYISKHDPDTCDGSCPFVGFDKEEHPSRSSPQTSIKGRLREALPPTMHCVPTVVFKNDTLEVRRIPLLAAHASGRFKLPLDGGSFVAISHVWADGLGNPIKNELPTCQLRRLQNLVNALFSEKQHPVPFWIDTLMIPKTEKDQKEADMEAKTRALGNMEWIYKNATKILVLDRGLLRTRTGGDGPEGLGVEELGARIFCSSWSRRLWTLQEGCKGQRTHFQFQDRTVSWPKLHKSVSESTRIAAWAEGQTKLSEQHVLRRYQSPLNLYLPTIGDIKLVKLGWRRLKSCFHSNGFRVLNPVWVPIYAFFQEMSTRQVWHRSGPTLIRCMRGMFYRDCSRPEDESLVLSSVIHTNPGSTATAELIKVHNSSERYKILFKSMSSVPMEVIFIDQQRLQEPGLRWIPTSLLGKNSPSSRPVSRNESDFEIMDGNHDNKGLRVRMPGFSIYSKTLELPSYFMFKHEDRYWHACVRDPGTSLLRLIYAANNDLVLIPDSDFHKGLSSCYAVLARIQQQNWYGTEILFEALVDLDKISEKFKTMCDLPFLKSDTTTHDRWIVG